MTRAERIIPYVFLAPAIILVIIFRIGPAVAGFREAVYANALSLNEDRAFVGLANFARVLNDPVFWSSTPYKPFWHWRSQCWQIKRCVVLPFFAVDISCR